MKHDELDRILAAEDEILPSSGFTASVMQVVRSEASAPMPIPFPWRRALPSAAAVIVTLVLIGAAVIAPPAQSAARTDIAATVASVVGSAAEAAMTTGAHWIALALIVTLVSVSLSTRLGSWRA